MKLKHPGKETSGSVRNASFSNIRGRDTQNGEWISADSVTFSVNNGVDDFIYIGSYQFGADDSSFYAITSGVSGLCEPVNCSFDDCNAK